MNIKLCRECEHYIIDDGYEVSCRFLNIVAYYEIRPARQSAEVYRCPQDSCSIKSIEQKHKT
jgi:hypothetical protein